MSFKSTNEKVVKIGSNLGQIIDKRFQLGNLIGKGSFGEVREGKDLTTKKTIAVKLQKKCDSDSTDQLKLEFDFYRRLGTSKDGFPEVFHFGPFGSYSVLVMEMLGKNLDDVFDLCQKQFTIKTIIYIFLQILRIIEWVHENHLVYRDIKPENFVLGLAKKENIIHLIDFGLAKQYRNPETKIHIPMKEGKPLTGSLRYMSLNAHLGKEQSRRDDLESIGYMIMYFVNSGSLPWSGLQAPNLKEKYQRIGEQKRATPIETLCYGRPDQFAHYFRIVRMLDFEDNPNYLELKWLFIRLFEKENFVDDGLYDWN